MSLESIKKHLEKFKNLSAPETALKREMARAIKQTCDILVPEENIQIYQNRAYIRVAAAEKSEIFLAKRSILSQLARAFPGNSISDIK